MKVAISGSSGFIGSALRTRLIHDRDGWEVSRIPRELLFSPIDLQIWMEEKQPDYIFHLAAYGNHAGQTDPNQIIFSNVIGLTNMLNATKNIPYSGFVNLGSSSEYGPKAHPMKEVDLPLAKTMYAGSKVACTYLARAYAFTFTKPIVTVRPFSVYGPGEAPHRFIPTVCRYLKKGGIMDVDIDAMHDWIFIDDVVNALILAGKHGRELLGQWVNVGSGNEYSNINLIKRLEFYSKKKLEVNVFAHMRPQDSLRWQSGETTLAKFGWKRKIFLDEGIKRCWEYYDGIIK